MHCQAAVATFLLLGSTAAFAQNAEPKFKVIVSPNEQYSQAFCRRRKVWLRKSSRRNFSIDYIQNTEKIDGAFLSRYQTLYPTGLSAYGWTPAAVSAFPEIH